MLQKIVSWKAKLLSLRENEVLLKSVAQALPSYVMSVFKLPKRACKKLMGAMVDFWWSIKKESGCI